MKDQYSAILVTAGNTQEVLLLFSSHQLAKHLCFGLIVYKRNLSDE